VLFAAMLPIAAQAKAEQKQLNVYAAASLTDAFKEIGALYKAAGHPEPVFVFAASSILAKQIDQGAAADIFASADEDWMNYLAGRRMIEPATRTSMLSNKLVLIAPADAPLKLAIKPRFDLKGALKGGKLSMANPDSVPAGKYGKAALTDLGIWETVSADVVRTENVRAALRFVEVGEAPAGIVYRSDAIASGKVAIAGEFPQNSHPPISYPMAAIKGGHTKEARAFLKFLRGNAAAAVFKRRGFMIK
jgi:molybdate transport system substrate-binding protein